MQKYSNLELIDYRYKLYGILKDSLKDSISKEDKDKLIDDITSFINMESKQYFKYNIEKISRIFPDDWERTIPKSPDHLLDTQKELYNYKFKKGKSYCVIGESNTGKSLVGKLMSEYKENVAFFSLTNPFPPLLDEDYGQKQREWLENPKNSEIELAIKEDAVGRRMIVVFDIWLKKALKNKNKIIIMDEPETLFMFRGDKHSFNYQTCIDYLKRLMDKFTSKNNITFVLLTHHPSVTEICDEIILLEGYKSSLPSQHPLKELINKIRNK